MACGHETFEAHVDIRKAPPEQGGKYAASVSLYCKTCGLQFQFTGQVHSKLQNTVAVLEVEPSDGRNHTATTTPDPSRN